MYLIYSTGWRGVVSLSQPAASPGREPLVVTVEEAEADQTLRRNRSLAFARN
jgi:hypothetical protein